MNKACEYFMSVHCKTAYLLTNITKRLRCQVFGSTNVYSRQQINSDQGGAEKWNIVPVNRELCSL
jgi:hypothetical protein